MSRQRKTTAIARSLFAIALIVTSLSVTESWADCTVRFTGRVDMPESPSGSECIGNYYVPVVIYEVLEDACDALAFYGPIVDVAYDDVQQLNSSEIVEVYGFACTNCPTMSCGMIDATKTSSEDYYIGVMPEAEFSATPIIGLEPLAVDFTDLSTGDIQAWSWDFNNDGIEDSSEQNPSFTFYSTGDCSTASVSLTVTSSTGASDNKTKPDYISAFGPLTVNFGAAPISGPPPLCVLFTASSNCPSWVDDWSWDFDNDGFEDATGSHPSQYCYSAVGTYTVSLTATGISGGGTETKIDFINVHTGPVIYKVKNKNCEPGEAVVLNGVNFGDGTNSVLHIGGKELPFGHKRIKSWTETSIKVRIPKKKYTKNDCSWFKGEDTRKQKIWVDVEGVESNKRRLSLTKPLTCP